MPEIIGEPLEVERAKALQAWLKKPECSILRTVAAAKCRLRQEEALKAASKADDTNQFGLAATGAMKAANRYSTFLEVLTEIVDQTEPLQTIKLKV